MVFQTKCSTMPKLLVPSHEIFWTAQHVCRKTSQSAGETSKTLDCPNLWGLRSPGGLTGSNNFFLLFVFLVIFGIVQHFCCLGFVFLRQYSTFVSLLQEYCPKSLWLGTKIFGTVQPAKGLYCPSIFCESSKNVGMSQSLGPSVARRPHKFQQFVVCFLGQTVQHFCCLGLNVLLGQYSTFVNSLAQMLCCPKVFVAGDTKFWDSIHFCCTVPKLCG